MFYNYVMELCFITVFYNMFIGLRKGGLFGTKTGSRRNS